MSPRSLTHTLIGLPPLQRRLLLMGADALLLPLAVWLSFWLRLAHPFSAQLQSCLWLLPAALLLGLPIYALSGQYKGLTRYVGSQALYSLALRNGVLVLLLLALGVMLRLSLPPRSSWLLLWLLLTGFTGIVRFVLRDLLLELSRRPLRRHASQVVIYGAGSAGAQLLAALRVGGHLQVVAVIDDDPALHGRELAGVSIEAANQLPQLLKRHDIDQVLLAMPSLGRRRRRQIVEQLQPLGLSVLQVPSMCEITSGQARIDTLRPIAIEELLGRDAVPPAPHLLGLAVAGKVVLVSGAAGSIGSELCRQIQQLGPHRLVLLDNHEPSLHAITQELQQRPGATEVVVAVLGSVTDAPLLHNLLQQQGIQVVFHAAAYKHVPIVEGWPLAGLHNNVIGTWRLAQAAASFGVESFTLISTDKAVRPSSVMGASKRVAELVVQALAREQRASTRFSMVRFGNVLGSSGSVVPRFREQIARGGPITLTHPEVMRYFMTIPEAAQLVLQAAALAEGGDLLLLDMGEPVRIQDLAEQMVRLSGLSVRKPTQPNGDIEIVCTGLRPGEKLYEELLIDTSSQPTSHPLIHRARERYLPAPQLWPQLEALAAAIRRHNQPEALAVLAQLVPEWRQIAESGSPTLRAEQPAA